MTKASPRLAGFILDNSLLLVAGTPRRGRVGELDITTYEHVAHPLHFWVNDVGMVFFFAMRFKEVFEATLPGGSLASHGRRSRRSRPPSEGVTRAISESC